MKRHPHHRLLLPLLLALLLPLAGFTVSGASDLQSETVTALSEYRGTYRQKETATGMTSHAVSDLLWNDYITPLAQHVDPTDAQIDLYAKKAYAVAPLSWIYHSHPELHPTDGASNAISAEYLVQKARIDGRTAPTTEEEKAESDRFFDTTVTECYTALLNAIYAEKILALKQPDDSEEVTALIDQAILALQSPDPTASALRYETEDAENYKSYLSALTVSIHHQRNRDAVTAQMLALYQTVVDPNAADLHGLTDPHILAFLEELPEKGSVASVNELLRKTADHLLSDLANHRPPYAKEYLGSALKNRISSAVAAATSNGKTADLTACLAAHPRDMHRAEQKDALTEAASLLAQQIGDSHRTTLYSILNEYVAKDGALDKATTDAQLTAEIRRAQMRFSWLRLLEETLSELDRRTQCFGATDASTEPFRLSIEQAYAEVDQAIQRGERDEDPSLLADQKRWKNTVSEAEADAFRRKHPIVLADLPTDTEKKREWLNALADTDLLSLDAGALLAPTVLRIKQACEAIYRIELLQGIGNIAENDPSKKHEAALLTALSDLFRNEEERASLLIQKSDLLCLRASHIGQVLAAYRQTAELTEEYADRLLILADKAADALMHLPIEELTEATDAAVARLLAAKNLLPLKEYAQAHASVPSIPQLLIEAEEALLSENNPLPTDPKDHCDDLLFRMRMATAEQEQTMSFRQEAQRIRETDALTEAEKTAYLAGLEALIHSYSQKLSELTDEDAHATVANGLTNALEEDRAAILHAVECHKLGRQCREEAEARLPDYTLLSDDRRTAYREAILEAYRVFSEQLTDQGTNPDDALSQLKNALQATEKEAAANHLSEAKAKAEAKITEICHVLLQKEAYYSPESLSALAQLRDNAKQTIQSTTDPTKADDLLLLADETARKLCELPLHRVYTADGLLKEESTTKAPEDYAPTEHGYSGAILGEYGLPYTASLSVTATADGTVPEQLRLAIENGRILLPHGEAPTASLLSKLRSGSLLATLCASGANTVGNRYTLSLLMPKNTDHRDVIGALRLTEQGDAVFYEITSQEDLITFTAEELAEFYLIREKTVNLLPLILLLSILLTLEIGALIALYLHRFLRKRRQGEPYGSVAAVHALPLVAWTLYRPAAGLLLSVTLGVAVLGLGAWLVLMLKKERSDAKSPTLTGDAKKEAPPTPVPVAVKASLEIETEAETIPPSENLTDLPLHLTLPTVTAEEADHLMSDEEIAAHPKAPSKMQRIRPAGKRAEINVDTVSQSFREGETVSLSTLKKKGLIPKNATSVKILARGSLDKPLTVLAQDFSRDALKMILLTGGTPRLTDPSEEA